MARALIALAVVAVLGTAALAWRAATLHDDAAYRLGVVPQQPVAPLKAGEQTCQRPIHLDEATDGVIFNPGTRARRSPAVDVLIRDAASGAVLSRGRLAAGFDPAVYQTVHFPSVSAPREISLCFRNAGPALMAVFGTSNVDLCGPTTRAIVKARTCVPGAATPTNSTTTTFVAGKPVQGDFTATLLATRPRSLLARFGLIMRRAALFRPAFAGPGLWWTLLVLCVLIVPALLALALRGALADRGDEEGAWSK